MLWKGFQRPKRLEAEKDTLTPTYGKFIAQPFERGFATTVGNALRRALLSSIEGAAVTAVRIDGVLHEFSSMAGVAEDVTDVILNLKEIPFRLHSEEPKVITLNASGQGQLSAADFDTDPQVEVCDPEVHVATLNESGKMVLEAKVAQGRGYVSAENNLDDDMGLGWIPVDSVHSPVRKVNYGVEAARVGRATDYERLVLEVWTNGTISPTEAVSLAATLLKDHLTIFMDSENSLVEEEPVEESEVGTALDALLDKRIDELDLSVRSTNSLKNANILTLRTLVARSEKEMLETKNFGRKSLEEVQEVLEGFGLAFGMDLQVPGRDDSNSLS